MKDNRRSYSEILLSAQYQQSDFAPFSSLQFTIIVKKYGRAKRQKTMEVVSFLKCLLRVFNHRCTLNDTLSMPNNNAYVHTTE